MDMRAGFLGSSLFRELQDYASEDDYPESEAKRHHLVPKLLLRRFVSPGASPETLCQLDLESGKPAKVTPTSAAAQTRFYRLTDEDGTEHQRLEFFLSRVESHAAIAIRELCEDPATFGPAQRATLAYFFALLEGRTVGGLERLSRTVDTVFATVIADSLSDPTDYARRHRELFGPASDAEVEEKRLEMIATVKSGGITLANPKEMAMSAMLEHASDSAQSIYQMSWLLLTSSSEASFVTSDRGLAMVDPTPPYPFTGNALLSSPNAETTIPLGRSRSLLLRPPMTEQSDRSVAVSPVDSKDVRRLNLRAYGWASRFVFADNQQTVTSMHAYAKKHRREIPKPKPMHQVMLIDVEPGDSRLADEHHAKGWPRQIEHEGEPHDYVVLDEDDNVVERAVDANQINKARAVKRLGSSDISGQWTPIDPTALRPL